MAGSLASEYGSCESRQSVVTVNPQLKSRALETGPCPIFFRRIIGPRSPWAAAFIAPGIRACMNGFRSPLVTRKKNWLCAV